MVLRRSLLQSLRHAHGVGRYQGRIDLVFLRTEGQQVASGWLVFATEQAADKLFNH